MSPTIPVGLGSVVGIAAGGLHSMALKNDGTVVAWGFNGNGETNIPVGLGSVVGIAAGGYHSLALKNDGTVVAWGDNSLGQTNVPAGLGSVVGIAAGRFHSMALKSDGTVVAWGYNGNGETNIPVGLGSVVGIAAGLYYSMALKNDGTVVAWGNNDYGQTTIPAGLKSVVGIAAGSYHSIALQSDGTVVAWGENSNGQTTIPVGLGSVVGIAAGGLHSMALKSDGTVVAWGNYDNGQTTIPAGLGSVVGIAAGYSHSIVLIKLVSQTITGFNSIPNTLAGFDAIIFPSTATSGLPVTYTFQTSIDNFANTFSLSNSISYQDIINNASHADVVTVTVKAVCAGNNIYTDALDVYQTFVVTKQTQTLTGFNSIVDQMMLNDALTFTGTSSSSLSVSYTVTNSLNTNSHVLNSNIFNMIDYKQGFDFNNLGIATLTITANQVGDAYFSVATPVSHSFSLALATPTITGFEQIPNQKYGNNPNQMRFRSTASNSSIGVNGPAYYDSGREMFYFLGGGVVTINGYSLQDDYYKTVTLTQYVSVTGFDEVMSSITGPLLNSITGLQAQITTLVSIINNTTTSGTNQDLLNSILGLNAQLALLLGTDNTTKYLATNPTELAVESFASNYVVNISSNCTWQTTKTADWVSINPTTGTGNASINVTLKRNTTPSDRQTIISISGCNTLLSTFILTQSGETTTSTNLPTYPSTSFTVFPNPSDGTITVQTAKSFAEPIFVYTIYGSLIKEIAAIQATETTIEGLEKGVYIIQYAQKRVKVVVK